MGAFVFIKNLIYHCYYRRLSFGTHILVTVIVSFFQAEIKVKVAAPKKDVKPKTAVAGKGDAKTTAGSSQPKPVKRPPSGNIILII